MDRLTVTGEQPDGEKNWLIEISFCNNHIILTSKLNKHCIRISDISDVYYDIEYNIFGIQLHGVQESITFPIDSIYKKLFINNDFHNSYNAQSTLNLIVDFVRELAFIRRN